MSRFDHFGRAESRLGRGLGFSRVESRLGRGLGRAESRFGFSADSPIRRDNITQHLEGVILL